LQGSEAGVSLGGSVYLAHRQRSGKLEEHLYLRKLPQVLVTLSHA